MGNQQMAIARRRQHQDMAINRELARVGWWHSMGSQHQEMAINRVAQLARVGW